MSISQIKQIWFEFEEWKEECNPLNANSDVIVTFTNDSKWIATFFSYQNIQSIADKNKSNGECLNGKYFWASEMILIDEISRSRISEVIENLLENSDFDKVFSKCI